MSIDEDVFSALTGGSPPLRVYPEVLPQLPTYPATTFTFIGGEDDMHLGGRSGIIRRIVQVDSWSTTKSGAYAQMQTAQTLMLASTAFSVNAINESGAEKYEPDTKLYRESKEYTLRAP